MTSPSPPRKVGPWSLGERLGKGGNGQVWRATRDGLLEEVALKTVASSPNKERYERFVREILTLLELGDREGILPTIEAYLPEVWAKVDLLIGIDAGFRDSSGNQIRMTQV